jgi:hypothetical protein
VRRGADTERRVSLHDDVGSCHGPPAEAFAPSRSFVGRLLTLNQRLNLATTGRGPNLAPVARRGCPRGPAPRADALTQRLRANAVHRSDLARVRVRH